MQSDCPLLTNKKLECQNIYFFACYKIKKKKTIRKCNLLTAYLASCDWSWKLD